MSVYPTSIQGTLFSFTDSYEQQSQFNIGTGYWLRFEEAGETNITGSSITDLTMVMQDLRRAPRGHSLEHARRKRRENPAKYPLHKRQLTCILGATEAIEPEIFANALGHHHHGLIQRNAATIGTHRLGFPSRRMVHRRMSRFRWWLWRSQPPGDRRVHPLRGTCWV